MSQIGSMSKIGSMSQIGSIQALRAGAALVVTFGHLEHEAATLPAAVASGFAPVLLDLTGAGVDLFFIISGFVMVHASRDLFGRSGAAPLFLARRLARIVPLYWMVTTLFLLTMLAAHVLSSAVPTAGEVVQSYLFVPYSPRVGGPMQPVYKLGWTLNYEMFFYLVFSVVLMLPARTAVLALVGFFVSLVAVGHVVQPQPGRSASGLIRSFSNSYSARSWRWRMAPVFASGGEPAWSLCSPDPQALR